MPKKLRAIPVLLADKITGSKNENGEAIVYDQMTETNLDLSNPLDKAKILKRQVENWFLKPATNFAKGKNNNFVVLLICLSYFEGIEQLKIGQTSRRSSSDFFFNSINKIYPGQFSRVQINLLYSQARCGLFHNGMTSELIILNELSPSPIIFEGIDMIKLNPILILRDIKRDFKNYLNLLQIDIEARAKFDVMYNF